MTIKDAISCVTQLAEEKTNKSVEVISIDPPALLSPIENRNFIADISKLKKMSTWEPLVGIDSGITETIRSMMAN